MIQDQVQQLIAAEVPSGALCASANSQQTSIFRTLHRMGDLPYKEYRRWAAEGVELNETGRNLKLVYVTPEKVACSEMFKEVRARPGAVRRPPRFPQQIVFVWRFVWARGALDGPKRRFPGPGSASTSSTRGSTARRCSAR